MLKLTEKSYSSDLELMEEHKRIINFHAREVLRKMKQKYNEANSPPSAFSYSNSSTIPTSSLNSPNHIIDKMLINYKNLPFIHLLFPHAIILHTVRDPIDTLFSCLKNRFGDFSSFTLDFESLVDEYSNYLRIMSHFRSVLPMVEKKKEKDNKEIKNGKITEDQIKNEKRGAIIDVRYETLLISPEKNLKKIFDFLEVEIKDEEWKRLYQVEEGKEKEGKDRLVKTASYLQVKEPLYFSSIGKWKKYAYQLEASGFLKMLRSTIKKLKKNKKFLLPYDLSSTTSSNSSNSSPTSRSTSVSAASTSSSFSTSRPKSYAGINWEIDLNFDYQAQIKELQEIYNFLEVNEVVMKKKIGKEDIKSIQHDLL